MESSASIQEIYKSLIKAQGDFSAIPFDAKNPHFGNKYVSLTGTQEHVRPILSKHGLGLIQSVESLDSRYYVLSRLIHESGEWIQSSIELMVDKKNMQGLGSATTYAKRYAAQAILGLSGDEDDDGNASSKDYSHKAPPQTPAYKPFVGNSNDFKLPFGTAKGSSIIDMDIKTLFKIKSWINGEVQKNPKAKANLMYIDTLDHVENIIHLKTPSNNDDQFSEFTPPPEEENQETVQDQINRLQGQYGKK